MIQITIEKDPNNPPGGILFDDNKSKGTDILTEVSSGDKVKWKAKDNSGVTIDAIIDTSTVQLFSVLPTPSNNFTGTIGDLDSGSEESYKVKHTINGVQYDQDPRLIMK